KFAMMLANFGTGSQVSLVYPLEKALRLTLPEDIEVRPYLGGCVLLTGSALCGGRAYGLWERFFSEYAAACGLPDGGQYEVMNKLAQKGMEDAENGTPALTVCTAFCGTRSHPEKRGSVGNIGESNLTPGAVLAGTVMGMAEELFDLYRKMPGEQITGLSASGNAVRRNPALRLALRKVFGKEPTVSKDKEEAARGAALFAAYVTFPGKIKPFGEQFIKLTGEDKNG
ncbi:MAG: hypothetical protein MJ078_03315, partial [Clostridia bacterium]|nr:hypothetical protein [Clostridia bacterium]